MAHFRGKGGRKNLEEGEGRANREGEAVVWESNAGK